MKMCMFYTFMYVLNMKAQKHACFHLVPTLTHNNGKGSIGGVVLADRRKLM